jgi:serine O-acetyltransferase
MIIVDDLRAKQRLYCEYGGRCSLLRAFFTDGTSAALLYRAQSGLAQWKLWPLALLCQMLNKWFNGCMIGLDARFGPGMVLVHPVGVVINSGVRAGNDVVIQSGVVLGENRGHSPRIGSHVFVGAGAKVIGALTVSDGARIGANAVVLHDVAPGDTVAGIPARPLRPSRPSALAGSGDSRFGGR